MADERSLRALRRAQDRLAEDLETLIPLCKRHGLSTGVPSDLLGKLCSGTFDLVVLGAFKRGKSTFINALLGEDVLPAAVVPVTSVMTTLFHGDRMKVEIRFEGGRTREIAAGDLAEYVAESRNPENVKQVEQVTIAHPASILRDRVRIIDTPGVGSVYRHQTQVAYGILPRADAAVFLLAADPPISAAECEFLRDIRPYAPKIFFVLNKVDQLSDGDRQAAIEFTTQVLARELGTTVELFPLSARQALQASLQGDQAGLAQSGLAALRDHLEAFLASERGETQLQAVRQAAMRLAQELSRAIQLERRAMEMPLAELEQSIFRFREARIDLERQQREIDLVLEAEAGKLANQEVTADLARLQQEQLPFLLRAFDLEASSQNATNGRALAVALADRNQRSIREVYQAWQIGEENRLKVRLEDIMASYISRINGTVERLHSISEELFNLAITPVVLPEEPTGATTFTFKFTEDVEVGLQMLQNAVLGILPVAIARPFVVRGAREHLASLFDRQAGRLRHDLASRIHESLAVFRKEVLGHQEEAMVAVEAAIQRGVVQRKQGTAAIAARFAELKEDESNIKTLQERISVRPDEGAGA